MQKKKIKTISNDDNDNNDIFDNIIFAPDEQVRTLSNVFIQKAYEYLKSSNIFRNLYEEMTKNNILLIENQEFVSKMKLINKIEEEKLENLNFVLNNLDKFKSKNSKINLDIMNETILNIPIENRSVEKIRTIYNSNSMFQIKSTSHIYSLLKNKLNFNIKEPDIKGVSFDRERAVKEEILFLKRLALDLSYGKKIMYFDECGMQQIDIRRKLIIHKSEDNRMKKNQSFSRRNILMICSDKEILYYETNTANTDKIILNLFFQDFFRINKHINFKDYILIMDNMKSHKDKKLLNHLSNNFYRISFIAAYTPSNNLIEFLFELLKRKLIEKNALDKINTDFKFHELVDEVIEEITEEDFRNLRIRFLRYILNRINTF